MSIVDNNTSSQFSEAVNPTVVGFAMTKQTARLPVMPAYDAQTHSGRSQYLSGAMATQGKHSLDDDDDGTAAVKWHRYRAVGSPLVVYAHPPDLRYSFLVLGPKWDGRTPYASRRS